MPKTRQQLAARGRTDTANEDAADPAAGTRNSRMALVSSSDVFDRLSDRKRNEELSLHTTKATNE